MGECQGYRLKSSHTYPRLNCKGVSPPVVRPADRKCQSRSDTETGGGKEKVIEDRRDRDGGVSDSTIDTQKTSSFRRKRLTRIFVPR